MRKYFLAAAIIAMKHRAWRASRAAAHISMKIAYSEKQRNVASGQQIKLNGQTSA